MSPRLLGTLSVLPPGVGTHCWSGYPLPEPARLIKAWGASALRDPGRSPRWHGRHQYERALAADGQLRNRSNDGRAQVRALAAGILLQPWDGGEALLIVVEVEPGNRGWLGSESAEPGR